MMLLGAFSSEAYGDGSVGSVSGLENDECDYGSYTINFADGNESYMTKSQKVITPSIEARYIQMEPEQATKFFIVHDNEDYKFDDPEVIANAIQIYSAETNCATSPAPRPALRLIGMNERTYDRLVDDPENWSQATDEKYS